MEKDRSFELKVEEAVDDDKDEHETPLGLAPPAKEEEQVVEEEQEDLEGE